MINDSSAFQDGHRKLVQITQSMTCDEMRVKVKLGVSLWLTAEPSVWLCVSAISFTVLTMPQAEARVSWLSDRRV